MRPFPPRRFSPFLSVLVLLSGGAVWLPAGQAVPATTVQGDWRRLLSPLLPQAGQAAQVMVPRPKVSVTEMRRRILDMGGNPQVLEQVLISVQRGETPIYNKNINISEATFRKVVIIQQTLQQSGKVVKLSVQFTGNRLTFGDVGGTSLLRGISLDLSSGEMRFPEGFSAVPESLVITAAEASRVGDPMGKRSGYVWKVFGSNAPTQTALKGSFALLALSDGSVLISYTRSGIVNGLTGTGSLSLNFNPVGIPAGHTLPPR